MKKTPARCGGKGGDDESSSEDFGAIFQQRRRVLLRGSISGSPNTQPLYPVFDDYLHHYLVSEAG
jgi:hypothetical protein